MRTIRSGIAGLTCGLALAGCAITHEQPGVIAVASMRASEPPSAERPREGWPPCYPSWLVHDLTGTDAVTGKAASLERGYVLHRTDVERVRVLDARAARCDQDLGICEQRMATMVAPSDFWDGSGGRVLLIGLGLLAGMGLTAGIAIALE